MFRRSAFLWAEYFLWFLSSRSFKKIQREIKPAMSRQVPYHRFARVKNTSCHRDRQNARSRRHGILLWVQRTRQLGGGRRKTPRQTSAAPPRSGSGQPVSRTAM